MLGGALLGCARTSPPSSVSVTSEYPDRCLIRAEPGERPETLTIALTDSVDPMRAPVPANDSEQLFFGASFETLVRVDCEGSVHAGAALAWTADSARRVWTFTLRDSSHPSNAPSSSTDFVASWHARQTALRFLGIEAASVQPDGRLRVTMRDPLDTVPRLFADPALAVSRHRDGAAGPLDSARVLPLRAGSGAIEFRLDPDADPRDVLDQGIHLMVTRDPALGEYAARKPGVTSFPLPWSRTYLLLQPPGADPMPRAVGRDAVRADARAAEPPFWWEGRPACGEPLVPASGPASTRVAHLRGDQVAQALAERVVALAGPGANLRTAPMKPAEFSASVANGGELAYIIAVPRHSFAPCRESAGWPSGATVHPLIDTRAHVIVRRGTPALLVDWDGAVRLLHQDQPAMESR